ncbi:MAG: hypothetical protein ABI679_02740 [Gemmatimonadota bacterium]
MKSSLTTQHLELARASYARCQRSAGFFRRFYDTLLASDPAIPPYFVSTSFEKQERLLQHGVSLLLIYARRKNPVLLQRMAERHGSADLAIPLRFYSLFVESFIKSVEQDDPKSDGPTLAAWRTVLEPGIRCIQAGA